MIFFFFLYLIFKDVECGQKRKDIGTEGDMSEVWKIWCIPGSVETEYILKDRQERAWSAVLSAGGWGVIVWVLSDHLPPTLHILSCCS